MPASIPCTCLRAGVSLTGGKYHSALKTPECTYSCFVGIMYGGNPSRRCSGSYITLQNLDFHIQVLHDEVWQVAIRDSGRTRGESGPRNDSVARLKDGQGKQVSSRDWENGHWAQGDDHREERYGTLGWREEREQIETRQQKAGPQRQIVPYNAVNAHWCRQQNAARRNYPARGRRQKSGLSILKRP